MIPVVLSAATSETVTINYAVTTGGTASSADFVLPVGTLTFAPGETTKSISLQLIDDGVKESDESVKISLSSPNGATLIYDPVSIAAKLTTSEVLFERSTTLCMP